MGCRPDSGQFHKGGKPVCFLEYLRNMKRYAASVGTNQKANEEGSLVGQSDVVGNHRWRTMSFVVSGKTLKKFEYHP